MAQLMSTSGLEQNYGSIANRFFYAIRRNEDGEIFLAKVDQAKKGDSVTIFTGEVSADTLQNFEDGQAFFEGRDVYHELVYPDTLKYEQYKWDDKNVFYYVDDDGYFTLVVNENHVYDDTTSGD